MKILFVPDYKTEDPEFVFNTERVLRCLGVSGKLTGFPYAVYMIERVITEPSCIQLITKKLYPETAKKFGVSMVSVERTTRTLIKACWKNENHDFLDYIAGNHLEQCPTNSEFLDLVASYLRAMR